MKAIKVSVLVLAIALTVTVMGDIKVIPYPRSVELGSRQVSIAICALDLEYAPSLPQDMIAIIEANRMLLLPGSETTCEKSFTMHIKRPVTKANHEPGCTSEEYSIRVTELKMEIEAECAVGAIRGIATAHQLMEPVSGTHIQISNVPLTIHDSPRFPHRGVMIDTSRHFLKLDVIKRVIDGMMLAKLNVLHWHLVDDDSFPMQSRNIPGLAESGAFSPKQLYAISDIKGIVSYAKTKGVRVIPEIDCPGHSIAVGKYKPLREIVTCWDSVWSYRGLEKEGLYRIHGGPPTGALDPSMDLSYEFMGKIIKDLAEYFEDEYVHLGGDEVMYNTCWGSRESIKEFMRKHNIEGFPHLMSYFIDRVRGLLSGVEAKRKAIYWGNVATFNLKYREEDVVQFWDHSKHIHRLKEVYPKNKFVLSPYDYLYLDCGIGNKYGGPSWCGDYKMWTKLYLFEPTNYEVPESSILGAEVCAWGEMNTDTSLELRLWPRVVALAETLWMPKRTGEVDLISLVRRLTAFSEKLNGLGIPTNTITRQFCALHPDHCFQKYSS